MSDNLNDWLGNNIWAWWLLLAVLLASVNLVMRSRGATLLSVGSAVAGLTAMVAPEAYIAQVLAGLLVLVVVAVVVRHRATVERG